MYKFMFVLVMQEMIFHVTRMPERHRQFKVPITHQGGVSQLLCRKTAVKAHGSVAPDTSLDSKVLGEKWNLSTGFSD